MKVAMKALCVLGLRPRGYLLQWNLSPSVIHHLALVLVLAHSLCEADISEDLIVNTNKGKIRGVTLKSATNK